VFVQGWCVCARVPSGFVIKVKTIIGIRPAPVMADFSSQGPNTVNPQILKVIFFCLDAAIELISCS
jgi:hypothetical protein